MAELVMKLNGHRAIGDDVIVGGNCCTESFEGEVVFVIQRDRKHLGMRINNKEFYRLNTDEIKMILEFIANQP